MAAVGSSTQADPRKQTVLELVQKLLGSSPGSPSSSIANAPQQSSPAADVDAKAPTFNSLSDGVALYTILHRIALTTFPDLEDMTPVPSGSGGGGGGGNGESSEARTNSDWMTRKGNLLTLLRHMNDHAKQTLGVGKDFSMIAIVDANSVANSPMLLGTSPYSSATDAGEAAFMELVSIFVVMVVLSGMPDVLRELKSLSRESQVELSNMAKNAISKYNLKPMRRYETPSSMSMTGGASRHPSTRPSTTNSTLRNAASPSRMSLLGASASASGTVAPLLGDDSYYRNATVQLRKELEEARVRAAELEAKYQLACENSQSFENKYRLLLSEQEGRSSGASADAMALLQQRLTQKDETIAALTAKVEEQSSRMGAFKEAVAAQEMGLQVMKKKLKVTEEGLMQKAEERRGALEKLSVAEDKLAIQVKARAELENDVEALQAEVTMLRLTQQDQANHTANINDDNGRLLNGSFASNGSVDRVLQLENEIDEARAQRDALQRQLVVLQRQLATMPASSADVTAAAADTFRAQVRQLQKEREDLKQQLAAALSRVEGEGNAFLDAAATASFPAVGEMEAASCGSCSGANSPGMGHSSRADGGRSSKEVARRDQTLLSAMLLESGYRNLLMQQHAVLLQGAPSSAEAAGYQREVTGGVYRDPMHWETARSSGSGGGSFLSRQRRNIERGLLESVIHQKPEALYAHQTLI